MRLLIFALLLTSLSITATAQKPSNNQKKNVPTVQLKTFDDSVAYAIGINIGGNLLRDELFLDLDIVKAGLNDVLYTKNELLSAEQIENIFQQFSMVMQEKQNKKQAEVGKINSEKAAKFLNENKNKPGVKVTPSGLQYEVVQEGAGAKPTAEDKVTVHYTGTLIDGTKFDSSVDRGEPVTFPLNGVIKGWTEGVQLMPVGSKFKFYIPAELGYGEQGAPGGAIGPNEALIFEVELIAIEK